MTPLQQQKLQIFVQTHGRVSADTLSMDISKNVCNFSIAHCYFLLVMTFLAK